MRQIAVTRVSYGQIDFGARSSCEANPMTVVSNTPVLDAGAYRLRRLSRTDTAALFPTFADEQQCRYMGRAHFETEESLADWLADPSWNGRSWVAVDKADEAVAGRFVVVPGRDEDVVEIGYLTVRERQGRGVATAAMTALIDYLFYVENRRRVFAEIDAENKSSIVVAERLGFVREGLLRQHETTHKGVCDMAIYGLLKDEWSAVCRRVIG